MNQKYIILLAAMVILSSFAFVEAKVFHQSGIITEVAGPLPSYFCDIYPWLSCQINR